MIGTAVDTNVLSEIFIGGPRAIAAAQALREALSAGPVLASSVVYAELCAARPQNSVYRLLSGMGIEVDTQMPLAVLPAAASAWQRYVIRRRAAERASVAPGTSWRTFSSGRMPRWSPRRC